MAVTGPEQDHVVAIVHCLEGQWVVLLAGRFFLRLTDPEAPPKVAGRIHRHGGGA